MDREDHIVSVAFPPAQMRPMDGCTELAVAEAAARPGFRPETVSWVLAAAYETIDGRPATLELVRALPSGSREWLLQQAAHGFRPDLNWFEATCHHCGDVYDLSLKLDDAARYQPDNWRAQIEVHTSLGRRTFAIPNGAHEEAHARMGRGSDPRRSFAALCGLAHQSREESLTFNEHDLALIDEALEAASPDVSDITRTACPACGMETTAHIDPLLFAFPKEGGILHEIHLIASGYGWGHAEILSLSGRHRAFFAAMIARQHRRAGKTAHWRPM